MLVLLTGMSRELLLEGRTDVSAGVRKGSCVSPSSASTIWVWESSGTRTSSFTPVEAELETGFDWGVLNISEPLVVESVSLTMLLPI